MIPNIYQKAMREIEQEMELERRAAACSCPPTILLLVVYLKAIPLQATGCCQHCPHRQD